jgi:hypothetical protein
MRWHFPVAMFLVLGLTSGCAQSLRPDMSGAGADKDARSSGPLAAAVAISGVRPTTWWAGPDPTLWPISTDGSGGRSVDVTSWATFTTAPAWPPDGRAYFGPDSFRYIPVARRPVGEDPERRTFYEIYGDRIYARSEGDDVHLNSWVVFSLGGSDRDSPYTPRVDWSDPGLPDGFETDSITYAVLHHQSYTNSPIGFRFKLAVRLANGTITQTPVSGMFPVFDPNSVFRNPVVMGYQRMNFAGKAYLAAGAEDVDGLRDDTAFGDPVGTADRVDAGIGTPAERLARRRIIVFDVVQ